MTSDFRHWLLDSYRVIDGTFRESTPYAVHHESNAALRGVVDQLAKELEIWTPEENLMDKIPMLKRAMYHLVGVLHPRLGTGGELQFDMVARICREVVRMAKEKHPQGKLDKESDDILAIGGTPVELIRYLKMLWGSFHAQAGLEGGRGQGSDYDAHFISRNSAFSAKYFGEEKPAQHNTQPANSPGSPAKPLPAPAAATSAPAAAGSGITVIRVLEALPLSVVAGKDIHAVQSMAAEIANNLGQTPPSPAEVEAFVKKRLVGEKA